MHNARHLPLKLHNSNEIYLRDNKSSKHDAKCRRLHQSRCDSFPAPQAVYTSLWQSPYADPAPKPAPNAVVAALTPPPPALAATAEESLTMLLGMVESRWWEKLT